MYSITFFDEVIDFFNSLNIHFQASTEEFNKKELCIYSNNQKIIFRKLFESNTLPTSEDDIVIHEDFWINRKPQVISRLMSVLKLNEKVHARKCIIKQIEKKEAEFFLNENHLNGFCKCATKIGLYHQDELVAVSTFSSGRKMNRLLSHQRSFELLSFASKCNITVVGGFDKLLQHFIKIKSPADIMTYVDAEFGNSKTYTSLGFEEVERTEPITFFIDKNFCRNKIKTDEMDVMIKNKGNRKFVKLCNA